MATLNPEMGISGMDASASITDVLQELKPETGDGDEKKANIVTDEIEEKDVAIQMLSVFIDELGVAFAEYVEPASRVLLAMVDYTANDSIRSTVAGSLPGLVKCAKEAGAQPVVLHGMARSFNEGLIKAMKEETDAEVMINQVSALKDIINECGSGFLSQDEINFLSTKSVGMIDKSLERIASLEKMKNEEAEDEDEELEEDDLALIKEENQNEYDLQLCAAELMGTIFKVAPTQVGDLVTELRTRVLKEAFESQVQKRLKFALFVLDDMVEHLGPNYFNESEWTIIVQTVASFAGHKSASLRQASAYGIGVIAQHGGAGFAAHADSCL